MSIAFELSNQRQGRAVLAALRKRFATAPGERSKDQRTCCDTFDWRLWSARAGLAIVRQGKGWLLHWRGPRGNVEVAEGSGAAPAFAWDLPHGRLRGEVEKLVAMRRLLPLIEHERSRQEVRLLDRREKTVARLRLEGARVRAPGARSARRLPSRLVATPVRGFDRAFERLVGFLEGEGLEQDTKPVLERAYQACGLEPGDYTSKIQVELEASMPAHLAMRHIHRRLLQTMRRNEPGLRDDLDSEFLHDFRVAVRRTRDALTQVKGVFPPPEASRFRKEFAWLGGQTGTLRDLDVYLLKLDGYRASLPAEVADDLTPLEELLRRRQRSEHRRVVRALDSARYRRLLSEWQRFLAGEETADTPEGGVVPIAELARERLLAAHAKVIRKGRAIDPSSPDEKLHRLRIDCKKLRYLLEFFRGLYGPDRIAEQVKALKALQDNLGDFNDLSVQQEAMRAFAEELAAAGTPPATLMALGRLIAVLARHQGEERHRFHQKFGRFDRPKVQRRLVRLVDTALP
jgi:CHAD domain-containing protein